MTYLKTFKRNQAKIQKLHDDQVRKTGTNHFIAGLGVGVLIGFGILYGACWIIWTLKQGGMT